MPIVPQVCWRCGPHDANCSAGLLKMWSAWCHLFRRFLEDVICMMPIVPQVCWRCGPHDANCSAGFLKMWSAWCHLFCRFLEDVVRMMPIVPQVCWRCGPHGAPPSPPRGAGRLDFALGGLRNSWKCVPLDQVSIKLSFLAKNNLLKSQLPFRFSSYCHFVFCIALSMSQSIFSMLLNVSGMPSLVVAPQRLSKKWLFSSKSTKVIFFKNF